MAEPFMPNNCPVAEYTADGDFVGRCWYWLGSNTRCPRHGDVATLVEAYKQTGELQSDPRLKDVHNAIITQR